MGSKTFDGVRFSAYSLDHTPPHVHATLAGVTLILDLLPDRAVRLSTRENAITPKNAKLNVQARIRRIAAENVDELITLWERAHGTR